jgi:hypothetical protein
MQRIGSGPPIHPLLGAPTGPPQQLPHPPSSSSSPCNLQSTLEVIKGRLSATSRAAIRSSSARSLVSFFFFLIVVPTRSSIRSAPFPKTGAERDEGGEQSSGTARLRFPLGSLRIRAIRPFRLPFRLAFRSQFLRPTPPSTPRRTLQRDPPTPDPPHSQPSCNPFRPFHRPQPGRCIKTVRNPVARGSRMKTRLPRQRR